MLNTCIRCSSLFVGLFSLIQALIWAAGSIWGIGIYDCTSSYPLQKVPDKHNAANNIAYIFYVSYLRGSCANPELKYVAPTAEASYSLMMAYSIISSIWVPASVMLLAGTCLGARGAKAMWIYFPWLIVTIACCVLDLYATVKYAIDIGNSMTSAEYIEHLKFPNNEVKNALGFGVTTGLDGVSFIPAIIMTLIACRVVILWIVNLFFIIFGFQGICAFYKKLPPKIPRPYHEYDQEMRQKELKNEEQCKEFKRPEASPNHIPNLHPVPMQETVDHGRINNGFMLDEPLRLNPVEVEVKQERINPIRYAEVEDIELEPMPEEISRSTPEIVHFVDPANEEEDPRVSKFNSKLEKLKHLGLIVPIPGSDQQELNEPEVKATDEGRGGSLKSNSSTALSIGESALEAEIIDSVPTENLAPSAPPSSAETPEQDTPRRVYDVNGNPTEERLTPRVARITKIIEAHTQRLQKGDLSGCNAKPFSYTQPFQPQVDSVPKKNDTVRGLDKPPIPVPDYSVRVSKKASFRTPLPHTQNTN